MKEVKTELNDEHEQRGVIPIDSIIRTAVFIRRGGGKTPHIYILLACVACKGNLYLLPLFFSVC